MPRERGEREKTKRATHTHITHHTLRIMYMPLYIPNIPMSIRPCSLYYASVSPCHAMHPPNSTQPPPSPLTSYPRAYVAPYFVLPPKTPLARPSKAPTISSTIPPATCPTATPSAAFANRYRIVSVTSDHPSSRPGAGETVHRVTRLSKIPPPAPVDGGREEGAGYPHANSVGSGIVVVAAPETASTIPPVAEGMEYTSEV